MTAARQWLIACGVAALTASPAMAAAEVVYLSSGRTMTVKSYRRDGDWITLALPAGGEITCPARLVVKVEPDDIVPVAPVVVATPPSGAVAERQARFARPLDGRGPYAALIDTAARKHDVDARLVQAVIRAESSFKPRARSRRGARGLMQLMPATARRYGVSNPFDPAVNIDAGTKHLRLLLDTFDLQTALAAYNAGAGAVGRHGGVPPYAETTAYVARILREVGSPPVAAPAASNP